MRYAVLTRDPRVALRLAKKHNVVQIIIIVDTDKPQRIAPYGQKYDIRIRKIDIIF